MAYRVRDILNTQALKGAKVVAGNGGLDKRVNSISVMEFFSVDDYDDYTPNEVVITAFYNYKDDRLKQMEALQYLYDTGAVALVIFYMDTIIKDVSDDMKKMADSLNFPIIVLDSKQCESVKYSDVIMQVSRNIFTYHEDLHHLFNTASENIQQLTVSKRNVINLIKIISRTFKLSIFLRYIDGMEYRSTYRDLNDYDGTFSDLKNGIIHGDGNIYHGKSNIFFYEGKKYFPRRIKAMCIGEMNFELILLSSLREISDVTVNEILTLMECFDLTWDYSLNKDTDSGKLYYIFKENSEKTVEERYDKHKLIVSSGLHDCKSIKKDCKEHFINGGVSENGISVIAGHMDKMTVAVISAKADVADEVFNRVESIFGRYGKSMLFVSDNMREVKALPATYYKFIESRDTVEKIYGKYARINEAHINIMLQLKSDKTLKERLAYYIGAIKSDELKSTLSVFLIDCRGEINKTADRLILHRNTVRYRIDKISSILGHDVLSMPLNYELYLAMALWRLMQ